MSPEHLRLDRTPLVFLVPPVMRRAIDLWGARECIGRSAALRQLLKRGLLVEGCWPTELDARL